MHVFIYLCVFKDKISKVTLQQAGIAWALLLDQSVTVRSNSS